MVQKLILVIFYNIKKYKKFITFHTKVQQDQKLMDLLDLLMVKLNI